MDQSLLSSRAIMGMYFTRLEAQTVMRWIDLVSNSFSSDQASETYNFLGHTPRMREWVGGRQAKGFTGDGITILNTHYEATIEFQKKDVRRDKTPQIRARIDEFVDEGMNHWETLLTDLLLNGPSTVCYDGQFFFDTDHVEGDSGTQDNDITVDISALPVPDGEHGTTTSPAVAEMQHAILKGISQILSFKDDRGRPMNPGAREFAVLVPTGLWYPAVAATAPMVMSGGTQNLNPNILGGLSVRVEMLPLLTWTDSFAVFRTDSPIKGLIRQTEQEVEFKAKAEGSEFEFDNDAWQFGIDAWRGVGYGYWQRACYVTLV